MNRDEFKTTQFAMLYEAMSADLGMNIDRLEYQQWQEEYRRLVFAQDIKVSNVTVPLSRRARRRQRKQK